jgi:hypothetical protein
MRHSDGFLRRSFAFSLLDGMDGRARYTHPFVATLREDAHVADHAAIAFGSLQPDVLDVRSFHQQIYNVTGMAYEGLVVCLYDLWPRIGGGEGPLDLGLRFTRDVQKWVDVGYPRRALRIGRFGEWDAGMVYSQNMILVVDDELRLYYSGYNIGHYTRVPWTTRPHHILGVGLATLRLDGFASMRAGKAEGALTTKPLAFQGKELLVNADCPKGSLTVELLDRDGKEIAGFGRTAADAFSGDELRHTVTWRGKSDVSALAGRPVRIRFRLREGDLYSFRFK